MLQFSWAVCGRCSFHAIQAKGSCHMTWHLILFSVAHTCSIQN